MDADRERILTTVYDAGLQIHRELGPGLLESVYETILATRPQRLGLKVVRQKPVDIVVDGIRFPDAYRVDLFVTDWLVIELKAVEKITGLHLRQTLTYLKLLNQPVGLLINFGEQWYKDGAHRVINNHAG